MSEPLPLLSACMIVRDEEANLPACLASLSGLVDEIVLYDTGSTDRTIAVAKETAGEMGVNLTVVEGYWDDDFSRARNASLARCKGVWALWIDADETVHCENRTDVRAALRKAAAAPAGSPGDADALEVLITNVTAVSSASTLSWATVRLIRRRRCTWLGRLHEQVVSIDSGRPVAFARFHALRLVHSGYTHDARASRNKIERNLRIARLGARYAHDTPFPSLAFISLARCLAEAGQLADAIENFATGLSCDGITPIEERCAYEGIATANIQLCNYEAVESALKRLWHVSDLPTLPSYLDATLGLHRSSAIDASATVRSAPADEASRCLLGRSVDRMARLGRDPVDDNGSVWGLDMTSPVAAQALVSLGHHGEAAEAVLDAATQGFLGVDLPFVISCFAECSTPISALVDALAPWLVKAVLAQASQLPHADADLVLEALFERFSDEESIAAVATLYLGHSLPAKRSALWASRLGRFQEAAAAATCAAGAGAAAAAGNPASAMATGDTRQ